MKKACVSFVVADDFEKGLCFDCPFVGFDEEFELCCPFMWSYKECELEISDEEETNE